MFFYSNIYVFTTVMPPAYARYSSVVMPVQTNDAYERFFELIVDERVTERVDGTVEVAQPVGDVVEGRRDTRAACVRVDCTVAAAATEPDQQRQDVPWRPAENERSEDDGDGAQRLASSVLLLLLLLLAQSLGLGARVAPTVARHDEVPERRHRHSRQRPRTGRRLSVLGGDDRCCYCYSCSRNGFRLDDALRFSLSLWRRWRLCHRFRFVDRHVFGRT